jgi:LytS/YehU family sensor histidine kinase
MKRRHAYWACQIGGWGLLVLFRVLLSYLVRDVTWGNVTFNVLLGATGLLLTHLYRLVAKRRGWTQLSLKQLIPRVVLAALVLATLTHFTCDLVGRHLLELSFYDEVESEMGLLLVSIVNGWILFMLWSVIYFGVHAVWNHRQAEVDKWKLEAQAETARLKALKLQLNPHFFFNSLNSVRALIAEDPDRAQRMVTQLARLLRNTLQVDDVKTVPLEEELSTVRTYLELETVRFEERLQYEIDASEAALGRPVPFLLVQTLVENGIKHGVAQRQEGGTITVGADVRDDTLCLRVTNPGTLDSEEGGVGLQNARERLQLLFGDEASLTLENADAETVVATAVLPTRSEPEMPTVREESEAVLVARE